VDRSQEKYGQSTLPTLHPYSRIKVPYHPDWIHEVNQDGFRLISDGDRFRLFTRNGYDWTSRYPLIVEAARRIRTNLASTGCIVGNTTTKSSSTPSTSLPWKATICATSPGC
jgi:ATP-dependent DNA ligase